MYLQFKNFTNNNVTMTAADGAQALIAAGSIATLDEKFTFELDHTCIRQLTFASVEATVSVPTLSQLEVNTDN